MARKSTKIKRPTKVKVGWKDIDIEYVKGAFNKDNTNFYGQFSNRENKIELQEDMTADDVANTLLHEVLHAVVYHASLSNDAGGPILDNDEEQIVNSIANHLIGVFRDNPWFLDFMKQNITKPTL